MAPCVHLKYTQRKNNTQKERNTFLLPKKKTKKVRYSREHTNTKPIRRPGRIAPPKTHQGLLCLLASIGEYLLFDACLVD